MKSASHATILSTISVDVPPHWPYSVCVAPCAVVVVLTVVGLTVGADVCWVGDDVTGGVEAGGEVELEFPPTLVVIGPDSMYTPEMYQFSGTESFSIRRTPTCQSSELVDVAAAWFGMT